MARNLRFLILLLLTLTAVGLFACQRHGENRVEAAGEENKSLADRRLAINQADKAFIIDAEKANLQERFLGRLAVEKSQNQRIKDYGQMLADDHSRALRNLVDLMQQKGMNQPTTLPKAREEAFDQFKGLSGPAFDAEFINMMIQDHEKAVDMFKHEVSTAQDNDVRKYASDLLPALEKHLQKALELKQQGVR